MSQGMDRDTASSPHHQMGVLLAKHSEPWTPCSLLGSGFLVLHSSPNPVPLLGAKGTHHKVESSY